MVEEEVLLDLARNLGTHATERKIETFKLKF